MNISQPADRGTLDRGGLRLRILLLGGLMIGVFSISLFAGRYPEPGLMSFQTLLNDELAQKLVLSLRLPRLITALLLGMSLSAAGNIFQMIFSNPLVEPGFLGFSQGASFGAAFSIILLGGNAVAVQGMALIFAFIGLGCSYLLARNIRFGGWVLRLVLSGIVISALFSSGLGVLKYLADPPEPTAGDHILAPGRPVWYYLVGCTQYPHPGAARFIYHVPDALASEPAVAG